MLSSELILIPKTMREFLRGKIHNAKITKADVDYEGSLGVDSELMRSAGLRPFESVEIYNVSNGHRLRTYLIELPPNSGRFESNGAAAHWIKEGDRVIIAAYEYFQDLEIPKHRPRIVILDSQNRPKEVYESNTDYKY